MDLPETIQLLRISHDEIVRLRAQVAALEPRAHAYDTIALLARQADHPPQQGYGEDPLWRVKQAVEALEAEREAERAAESAREAAEEAEIVAELN